MEFKFKCPNCLEIVNISDENLDKHTSEFNEFKNSIVSKYEEKHYQEIKKQLERNYQEELRKQVELKELNIKSENKDKINNLEKQIEWLQLEKEKSILNKEKELTDKYLTKINELEKALDSSDKDRELALKQKELEINNTYSKLLEEVNKKNSNLENKLNTTKLEFQSYKEQVDNILKSKVMEVELSKNNMIASLTEEVNNLKNSLKTELILKEQELLKMNAELLEEKDKIINELKLANATNRILNNKIKGENWELEVETELRKLAAISNDEIKKITRVGNKADYLQIVKVDDKEIGRIVFECKNGEWKESWETKLAEDMAKESGSYAILVATSVVDKFKIPFLVSDKNKNIFIADPESFAFVIGMIRRIIIMENNLKNQGASNDVMDDFGKWKTSSFELFKSVFQKSINNIEGDEKTIINKVADITKNREIIVRKFQELIINFIESFTF